MPTKKKVATPRRPKQTKFGQELVESAHQILAQGSERIDDRPVVDPADLAPSP